MNGSEGITLGDVRHAIPSFFPCWVKVKGLLEGAWMRQIDRKREIERSAGF